MAFSFYISLETLRLKRLPLDMLDVTLCVNCCCLDCFYIVIVSMYSEALYQQAHLAWLKWSKCSLKKSVVRFSNLAQTHCEPIFAQI
jgi:hypothetical protein